jgi:AraC-like DNA-binding protein
MLKLDTSSGTTESSSSMGKISCLKDARFNAEAFDKYRCLQKVYQFVLENWREKISLSQVANIGALETAYFSRFFKSKVGMPFTVWLRLVRIAKAVDLLETSDCTITEIAHQTGFNDLRTFERAFKKVTGSTPREFRNGKGTPMKTKSAAKKSKTAETFYEN